MKCTCRSSWLPGKNQNEGRDSGRPVHLSVILVGERLYSVASILLIFSDIVTKPGNNSFVVPLGLAIRLRVVLCRG